MGAETKTATVTDETKKTEEKVVAKTNSETESDKGDDTEQENSSNEDKIDPAYVKKLKDESVKRRVENKALKERLDRQDKALAILQGKPEGEAGNIDPIEKLRTETSNKLRNALLKAELATLATDAHDASVLFKVLGPKLNDVTVDLDSDEVSRDELKEIVVKAKKEMPFLFKVSGDDTRPANKTAPLPKDKGQPTNAKSIYAEYQQLKGQGRVADAQEFYNKNRAAIMAELKAR